MKSEWDIDKANINSRKHKFKGIGITFEEAQEVFEDPFYLEKFDYQNSTSEEERFRIIGRVKRQLVVFVVYTPRNGKQRIISARAALAQERKEYYDRIRTL